MKNSILLSALLIMSMLSSTVIAQSTFATNAYCGGCYLGWNNVTTNPLDIKTNAITRMTFLGTNGFIGIGTTAPTASLNLSYTIAAVNNIGIKSDVNGGTASNIAIQGNITNSTLATSVNYALNGNATNTNSAGSNYGCFGFAQNAQINYGVQGGANGSASTTAFGGNFSAGGSTTNNTGVRSLSVVTGGALNMGGDFFATGATQNIAVKGKVNGVPCPGCPGTPVPPNFVAIYGDAGGTTLAYAGYFNGIVLTTAGGFLPSDETLKHDIQDYSGGLTMINKLKPKTYLFNTDNTIGLNLPSVNQYGFLTQDVKEQLPELVREATQPSTFDSIGNVLVLGDSFEVMNYTPIITILVSAVQELSAQVSDLQTQLNSCCPSGQGFRYSNPNGNENSNQQSVVLKDVNAIILDQNAPNPFAEKTTITYTIPDAVTKAQLIFFDSRVGC